MCEIFSKLAIKTPGTTSVTSIWWSLLLTLNKFHTFFDVSIVDFEEVNAGWEENLEK